MADSATATGPPTTSVPDLAKSEPRYLRRGSLQAWVAPGVDLERAIAADGDPDHLLMRPDCRIVKLQRKVVVGRVETSAGARPAVPSRARSATSSAACTPRASTTTI